MSGQSISDINRLKKQYEKYLKNYDGSIEDTDIKLDKIDGDLPESELIDLEDIDEDIDEDICPECKFKVKEDQKFCPECGADLNR